MVGRHTLDFLLLSFIVIQVAEDPFFFCDDCFRQFNYNRKEEKIGNFLAYHYIDVNAI
jgi:hypothetical protein